jgi:hypothetical protein
MDYVEFYSWSQRWFMENFPPLPLVKYESPCYDPYEIDPSHYPNPYDFNNLDDYDFNNLDDYDFNNQSYNNQSYNNQSYTENYSYYEYESSESDLEEDTP